MRLGFLLLVFLLFQACIPISIAPNLHEGEVIKSRKLVRKAPLKYAYGFNDPKDANEFYNFINMKYDRNNDQVEDNVPITIDNRIYFLSFYETEKSTKTINLLPIVVDGILESNDFDPMLTDAHVSRNGNWYITLTVADLGHNDALHPSHRERSKVASYLKGLQGEYLSTQNYNSLLFKE
jgi:hypothetical protein|tara:strand:+ start:101240 stop:101779 length:540 start_codon:yes stop_codon:yes gene_type:complete